MNAIEYNKQIKEAVKAGGKMKKHLGEIAFFWQEKIKFTDDIGCDFVAGDGICLQTDYNRGCYVIPIRLLVRLETRVEITAEELLKYSI